MTVKTFAELKKNRSKLTEKLNSDLTKLNAPQQFDDNVGFWYPDVDKVGNGEAIIRFLPAPPGEESPFVRLFKHSFKGPTGSWYIENCLTTIGQTDPVTEYNTQLWNSGSDEAKNQARDQKRKLEFICNVYVLKDKQNPENEGKVFKFRFGKKIFDKLNALMNPEFDDEQQVNPFDLWEGANFRLRIKKGDSGFRNYDSSKFDDPAPLFDDDKKMEDVWKQCNPLAEIVAPDKFKSYDELKAKLLRVIGNDRTVNEPTAAPIKNKTKPDPTEDDDDDLSAFKKLMEDDE